MKLTRKVMCAYTFEITKWKIKVFTGAAPSPKVRYSDSKRLHSVYVYVALTEVGLLVISIAKKV